MSDNPPVSSMCQHVYDLSVTETNELTRELLSTQTTAVPDRFVCFELDGCDPFANIARQVERRVFEDSWGNNCVTMKKEYGPYDESSLFFLAIDMQTKVPAGVLRMIRNSPAGLKTLVDLDDSIKSPIAPVAIPTDEVLRYHGIDDLDRCWDCATAAVPRLYRGRSAHMEALVRAWLAAAMRENVEHFVAVLDGSMFKVLRDVLGLPLVPLVNTPPFTHMDAPNNQAVYANVSAALAAGAEGNRKVGQWLQN
jgi:hypothetical protein